MRAAQVSRSAPLPSAHSGPECRGVRRVPLAGRARERLAAMLRVSSQKLPCMLAFTSSMSVTKLTSCWCMVVCHRNASDDTPCKLKCYATTTQAVAYTDALSNAEYIAGRAEPLSSDRAVLQGHHGIDVDANQAVRVQAHAPYLVQ